MSDIKNVLPTLCNYIHLLINIDLTPEHMRLAKYNAPNENVADTLWSTLHILSYYAAREKRNDVDFRYYDKLSAVKLHLAFLQYPTIEFYSLSRNSNCNRDLLIALAWLLGTEHVLTTVLRIKLVNSALGAECSHLNPPEPTSLIVPINRPLSMNAQLDNILHLNTKVNLNLKEIPELICERGRLISKVHAASIDVSGLPHLNVSELALMKRLVTNVIGDDSKISEEDQQRLQEFREAGNLLDVHFKWLRKQYVFFDWMATVIQEHRRSILESKSSNPQQIDARELAAFSSLLHQIIREKLRVLKSGRSVGDKSRNLASDCPSRTYRSQCNTETQYWLDDLNERQNREEENLEENRKRLSDELKEMLKSIPSAIQV